MLHHYRHVTSHTVGPPVRHGSPAHETMPCENRTSPHKTDRTKTNHPHIRYVPVDNKSNVPLAFSTSRLTGQLQSTRQLPSFPKPIKRSLKNCRQPLLPSPTLANAKISGGMYCRWYSSYTSTLLQMFFNTWVIEFCRCCVFLFVRLEASILVRRYILEDTVPFWDGLRHAVQCDEATIQDLVAYSQNIFHVHSEVASFGLCFCALVEFVFGLIFF